MRIWHYELLPYLPDLQFRGQLRELVTIMRDWRDKGKTNHLLINRVMEYDKAELTEYFFVYENEYNRRYTNKLNIKYNREFVNFAGRRMRQVYIYTGWHDKEYLRVCMANLYEKHFFGIGKSRITDEEWARLCEGYKKITGEEYVI